jgi:uncharacterized protein YheU (UPF0270 family)
MPMGVWTSHWIGSIPETLRKIVEESVTREWSDLADAGCTFEDKIEQVMRS